MPRHFQDLKFEAEKISSGRFLDQKIGFGGLDFEFKAKTAEKFAIGNHRRSVGMTTNRAIKPLFNFSNVLDVIDMTMGKEQKFDIDIAYREPIASAIWCVENYPALGR